MFGVALRSMPKFGSISQIHILALSLVAKLSALQVWGGGRASQTGAKMATRTIPIPIQQQVVDSAFKDRVLSLIVRYLEYKPRQRTITSVACRL